MADLAAQVGWQPACQALTLGACAVVPGPAFSRVVQTPTTPADPLVPGERIAVVEVNPARDGVVQVEAAVPTRAGAHAGTLGATVR